MFVQPGQPLDVAHIEALPRYLVHHFQAVPIMVFNSSTRWPRSRMLCQLLNYDSSLLVKSRRSSRTMFGFTVYKSILFGKFGTSDEEPS
jgi:hypothetical protein